jgi:2-polyprenyl-6-methoxyphenol hydroxylase-like FAD-dependent oxidoreductase
MLETPVLIVGGGPVGLTASILLSQQGIRSLLVERHPGTRSCRRRAESMGPGCRREALLLKRECK